MPIFWVQEQQDLPLATDADSNGLVAAGLDLSPQRLHEAYSKGLFPWFSEGDPVLWWSPNPRMILQCANFYRSHSLKKRIRQFDKDNASINNGLIVTVDTCFNRVINACSERTKNRIGIGLARRQASFNLAIDKQGRNNTWITPEIKEVYSAWSHTHSVETWIDGKLVGGLYGVSIGQCFFGESMFSYVTDSSKVALAYLVAYLQTQGVEWVDCQQETPHLASLGAKPIKRSQFLQMLASGIQKPQVHWGMGRLRANGVIESDYE